MCCNESSNLLISLIATKCISRWGNSGDKWWESWGVLTIVKISPCGEKALLKMRYLSFDFWLVSFPQKLILQLNFLPEFTFTRAITESRKLQQFAKKINCLDFMKTCIIFVWSKILLLSLKTFCLLNSDVPSIMKELRWFSHPATEFQDFFKSILWRSLLWRDKNAKQRENKRVFNLTWEIEKVVTSLSDLWREFFTESDN